MQATINGIRMHYDVSGPDKAHVAEEPAAFHGHVIPFFDKHAK